MSGKLALGTVQFGCDYGISNQGGQVVETEIKKILSIAKQSKIDTLDTAKNYGNAESVLGHLEAAKDFNLITKLPDLSHETRSVSDLVRESLTKLNSSTLDGLLFHCSNNLLSDKHAHQYIEECLSLKAQGVVTRIGVSVYTPNELIAACKSFPIDIVQIPFNIFDQRFNTNEVVALCQSNKIVLQCRSIFLQGLIFTPPDRLPSQLAPFEHYLQNAHTIASKYNATLVELALSLLFNNQVKLASSIEQCVVGVCSSLQLIQLTKALEKAKEIQISKEDLAILQSNDIKFINPSNW